jgi:hypothetical protein
MCLFEALVSLLASSPKDASLLSQAAYSWQNSLHFSLRLPTLLRYYAQ